MRARELRSWARALVAIAAAVVACTVAVAPVHAAVEDGSDSTSDPQVGISVRVIGPTAAPGPGSSPGGSSGNGSVGSTPISSTTSSTTVAGSSTVNTAPVATQPALTDVAIAGGVYISEIAGSTAPTLNPFAGRVDLWFTVRNLSSQTIDASADFSIATAFGTRIDGVTVPIAGLKPGEARVVSTVLSGSGQWPFVVGRMTFQPPETIDAQQTAPVSRAAVLYVFPWLATIAMIMAALAMVLFRIAANRERDEFAPAVVTA